MFRIAQHTQNCSNRVGYTVWATDSVNRCRTCVRGSRMAPSNFSIVATGSATPATTTESIEVAERSWFDRYQSRTVEFLCWVAWSHGQIQLSVICILLMSDAETLNDISHWRRIITVPEQNLAVCQNYSRTDRTTVGWSSHICFHLVKFWVFAHFWPLFISAISATEDKLLLSPSIVNISQLSIV